MLRRRFVPPVRAVDGGYEVTLGRDERDLLIRLLGELSAMLTADAEEHQPLLAKLFPPAYPDDEEKEAEYQRLMRTELVASRLEAIGNVLEILRGEPSEPLDEEAATAFMQSINAVRLVLGSMLGITDDETADEADDSESPEHQLYTFLSWLLEWTVQALSASA